MKPRRGFTPAAGEENLGVGMKDCPVGLTDILISLTFMPSQYELVSLIIVTPTFPGKGRMEATSSKWTGASCCLK